MQTTKEWLAALKSDGITLDTPELVRYQQLTRLLNLKPATPPQAMLSGAYLTRQKGRGMEFDEARHYQPGDDIRAIDWRVTARTGKTHTKIYREERERPVFVLCDLGRSMQFGTQLLLKSVQAAHITALISWSAASRGDKVGAVIFNESRHRECKPQSRKRAVLSICHELKEMHDAERQGDAAAAFSEACMRLRRLARPGSLVYLVSDFSTMDEKARQHVSQLARHCEVQAIRITDPVEDMLPQVDVMQPVAVTDGSITQTWLLGDEKQQQHYSAWRDSISRQLNEFFVATKIHLRPVSAGLPLEVQMGDASISGGRR